MIELFGLIMASRYVWTCLVFLSLGSYTLSINYEDATCFYRTCRRLNNFVTSGIRRLCKFIGVSGALISHEET